VDVWRLGAEGEPHSSAAGAFRGAPPDTTVRRGEGDPEAQHSTAKRMILLSTVTSKSSSSSSNS
jgi:hypothetical protein